MWGDRGIGLARPISSANGLVVTKGCKAIEGPIAVLMLQTGLALPAEMHLAHDMPA